MQKKRQSVVSSIALGEIFLILSMSFAIAFLLSEEVGVVSAVGETLLPGSVGYAQEAYGLAEGAATTVNSATPVLTKTPFSLTKGVGQVASGKATFGFTNPVTAGVAGSLAQGLFWGGVLYVGVKLLAPLLGVGKETTNALATAALVGGIGGGAIKASLVYFHGTAAGSPGIWSLSAGQAGFFGGLVITAVVFLLLYKKEKKQLVSFQCLPWEP
ncbi:MAG TPA: hypothetical protein VJK03_04390, partial [Candidatus Nanoarchaeia archaeon]|nr:hypothetical protein [Candidatus Nanoarchaeia archaeon]